jgi:hypothetical protein
VGAEHDRGAGAGQCADDVAQAGVALDRLEAPVGQLATQDLGQPAQLRRPGRALAVAHLAADQREGALGVEAIDARTRHGGRRGRPVAAPVVAPSAADEREAVDRDDDQARR